MWTRGRRGTGGTCLQLLKAGELSDVHADEAVLRPSVERAPHTPPDVKSRDWRASLSLREISRLLPAQPTETRQTATGQQTRPSWDPLPRMASFSPFPTGDAGTEPRNRPICAGTSGESAKSVPPDARRCQGEGAHSPMCHTSSRGRDEPPMTIDIQQDLRPGHLGHRETVLDAAPFRTPIEVPVSAGARTS